MCFVAHISVIASHSVGAQRRRMEGSANPSIALHMRMDEVLRRFASRNDEVHCGRCMKWT